MQKSLKNRLATNVFLSLDRVGMHVMPKHFYTPISDHSWLRMNKEAWQQASDMHGVVWDLDSQFTWLRDTCGPYLHEVAGLRTYDQLQASGIGYGYGPIESQVLHCFIRKHAPAKIVEVGSGVTTACMLEAIQRNDDEGRYRSLLTCIDPNPKSSFLGAPRFAHVKSAVQTVDPAAFAMLDRGDFLFIDCSHSVKTGSDVIVLYLRIIPKLRPGVIIHIHDINLPYLYFRETLTSFFEWQETALLAALLTDNPRLRVLSCLSGLHYGRQEELKTLLPDYHPQRSQEGLAIDEDDPHRHFPSSIYLEVV